MRTYTKSSANRIGRSERAGQALGLRKAGKTFREIGQQMGFSEQRAYKIVTQELARLNALRAELAEAVSRLELERLDALHAAVWEKALTGDGHAIDRVLAIMTRRAKLLGIDKEEEWRRLRDLQGLIQLDKVMAMWKGTLEAIRAHVTDPTLLRQITADVLRYMPAPSSHVAADWEGEQAVLGDPARSEE